MAGPEDTETKKSLADVVEQLQTLNASITSLRQEQSATGSVSIRQGKFAKLFRFLRLRATKKAAAARLKALNELQDLNLEQARYDADHQKADMKLGETNLEQDRTSDAAQEAGDTELRAEISQQSK